MRSPAGLDSQRCWRQIERAYLFLVPLDEVRGWWRYHQLFADLLRVRLRQQRPERIPVLHRNAAAWHSEHGPADAAVRHAIAAGDMNWAARLMEKYFDELFYLHGEGATLERWFSALPAGTIRSRPRLLVARAAQADTGGRAEEVGGLLDAAEHAYADAADEPFEPSAGRAASLLVNVPATIAVFRAYLAELRGDAEGALSPQALARSAKASGCSLPAGRRGAEAGADQPSRPSRRASPDGGRRACPP
jgi:LuxR family maltose regulon positive regulatory protein